MTAVFENLNDILKSDNGDIQMMSIEKIDEFEDHPFNLEITDDLKQSIERNGILNPIIIRQKINGRYEVLSGHRRLKTAKALGYTEVPVIIKDYDDKTAIQVMIESNNQRTVLLPSEIIKAFSMLKNSGVPLDESSSYLNKSQAQIYRYLKLENLNYDFMQELDDSEITQAQAYFLSMLDKGLQSEIFDFCKGRYYLLSTDKLDRIAKNPEEYRGQVEIILQKEQKPKKPNYWKDILKYDFFKEMEDYQIFDFVNKAILEYKHKLDSEMFTDEFK